MVGTILGRTLSLLPRQVAEPLRAAGDTLRAIPCRGTGRWCPVCGKSSCRFRTAGLIPREDAECAHCTARERHRLVWLYLTRKTNLFDGASKRMLHVAPEKCFRYALQAALGPGYVTADLHDHRAMVKMNITRIDYQDDYFDVIYCSHVLEHVTEDRRAMREFHRVLRPTGWAILLVPITAAETFEDPTVTEPVERLRLFGQADHVRRYGPDYVDRLREAGFRVSITSVRDLCEHAEAVRMGLTSASGEIYHCTKQ
jgi:SAM-dependent methyltransferase